MTRVELTLSFVFLFAMIIVGLRLGWQGRTRRQADLPAPQVAPEQIGAEVAPAFEGLYIGTTISMQWQNRVIVHGLGARSNARALLSTEGVFIQRAGADTIFIPDSALIDARLEAALAGKVVGKGGILVLRWRLGDNELDTGLRGDDRTAYVPWIRAIESRTSTSGQGAAQ